MAAKDLDIDQLAAYLHLTPAQVGRLADRGKLPGRKISGQWRFSEAEIHHWLEERIGASDADELVDVEDILDRSQQTDAVEDVSIGELLHESAIAVPLSGRTRGSVISEMSELGARSGLLWDPEKMAEAVRAREHLHPTALDNGAALLHPRRPLASILAEPLVALGRTTRGIPFGGARGTLTDIFFLICSTDDRIHLRTLARLSRLIAIAEFLPQLREAADAATVLKIVRAHEATLE